MAQIGTFTRDEDGSYTGTIRTLSLDIKVRFVPTEPSQNDKAPDLRVLAAEAVDDLDHKGDRSPLRSTSTQ